MIMVNSPYIIGDPKYMNEVFKRLGYPNKTVDCQTVSSYPDIQIRLGSTTGSKKVFNLQPQDYFIETKVGLKTTCTLGLIAQKQSPYSEKTFIIGDIFLRKIYTHFDITNNQVGFVEAADQIE